jgi:methylated-DNA-protein-cysteine methyltransferase-like protein
MNKNIEVFEKVYNLVSQIPKGKVVTYGDLAAPFQLNPRYIGYILHHNPYPGKVPCHRVVNTKGQISSGFAFGGPDAQKELLEAEGIYFKNNVIDLKNFRHRF